MIGLFVFRGHLFGGNFLFVSAYQDIKIYYGIIDLWQKISLFKPESTLFCFKSYYFFKGAYIWRKIVLVMRGDFTVMGAYTTVDSYILKARQYFHFS